MFGTLTLRVSLLVAALAAVGGMVGYAAMRPPGAGAAPAPQVDRVALVQQWYEARNQGDADAAMAMLTADAVLAHGPCPLATPCVGEANRPIIASGTQHTVLTMQESGSAVVGRIEIRNSGTRAAGVDRVLRNILVQIPTDKIAYYVAIPDFTDPDTARLAAQ
jgi:hypothetical protein